MKIAAALYKDIIINGLRLHADHSGALLWPEEALLVVADLHLEKGSAFARRGRLLPPYDTRATLDRLEAVLLRCRPRQVICLGDSFHDDGAIGRMAEEDMARLSLLTAAYEWIWICGNHDPSPPYNIGGRSAEFWEIGPLHFRHRADPAAPPGEVSGHYHPVSALRRSGRKLRARCFAGNGDRIILPAFGAYTGGLNVLDQVFTPLFTNGFSVWLLGNEAVYHFTHNHLLPDRLEDHRQLSWNDVL